MKMTYLIPIIFLAVLLTSCSTTKFTEYRGPAVVQGTGGTVRVVDGIDFWENGDPDRKYKILGVIKDDRGDSLFQRMGKDSAIAKLAREKGGNAVILDHTDRLFTGANAFGTYYQQYTKLTVVEYIE